MKKFTMTLSVLTYWKKKGYKVHSTVRKSGATIYINDLGLFECCGKIFHNYADAYYSQDW